MQATPLYVGIDVSKSELVISVVHHPQCDRTIRNEVGAIEAWLDTLPSTARLAVESTGSYHQSLVMQAQARGLLTYVLNAYDVALYAKSLGHRGKTDRADARAIGRYLQEHHERLHPFCVGSVVVRQIHQLLQRRVGLVTQRDSLKASLKDLPSMKTDAEALFAQFEAFLQALDQQIERLLQAQPELHETTRLLQSVPGIGPQGAAWLGCLFTRLAFSKADALVAFTGLDPTPRDSGQMRGRRRLSKRGSPLLRRQLYMMAFSACRTRIFKPVYEALRQRHSTTAAFVILARKLLKIAFAVWRTKTPFDAARWRIKETCAEL